MERVRERNTILGIFKNVFSSLGSNETEPQNDEERKAALVKLDPENSEKYKEADNYISKNLESMFRESKKVKKTKRTDIEKPKKQVTKVERTSKRSELDREIGE